jgi:hypothetical protein
MKHRFQDVAIPQGTHFFPLAGLAVFASAAVDYGVEVPLRAMGRPPHVAVWTGGAQPDVLSEAERLRPDAFFYKPRDVGNLIAWLVMLDPDPS